MQPLISVITPFYNMEAFLADAVESVIKQDYPNWELLLVDDGSADRSSFIARKYAEQYPARIFYLAHDQRKNRGLTASRNLALLHARGDYIALLDADDYWLQQKLSRQVAIAATYPDCALIGGSSLYWYSWSNPSMEDQVIRVGCDADCLISPPQLITKLYPLGTGAAPCPCSLLIKTDILKQHRGFEEQFRGIYQMYEDQAFLTKLYLHESCYFTSDYLDQYRQRPQSLVAGVHETGRYRQVRKFFLEWLKHYLDGQRIKDQDIRRALKHALMASKSPWFYQVARWWYKMSGQR